MSYQTSRTTRPYHVKYITISPPQQPGARPADIGDSDLICRHITHRNVTRTTIYNLYIRIYIHTHTRTHTHTHTNIYIHTYTHTYIHTCVYTYIHTYIHIYIIIREREGALDQDREVIKVTIAVGGPYIGGLGDDNTDLRRHHRPEVLLNVSNHSNHTSTSRHSFATNTSLHLTRSHHLCTHDAW